MSLPKLNSRQTFEELDHYIVEFNTDIPLSGDGGVFFSKIELAFSQLTRVPQVLVLRDATCSAQKRQSRASAFRSSWLVSAL
jgi:hypothetical protein